MTKVILRNEPEKVPLKRGSPESFGWQRLPDLDTDIGLAYERPSGGIFLFRRGIPPYLEKMDLQGPFGGGMEIEP